MKTYVFDLTEYVNYSVEVQAESLTEAEEKARNLYETECLNAIDVGLVSCDLIEEF